MRPEPVAGPEVRALQAPDPPSALSSCSSVAMNSEENFSWLASTSATLSPTMRYALYVVPFSSLGAAAAAAATRCAGRACAHVRARHITLVKPLPAAPAPAAAACPEPPHTHPNSMSKRSRSQSRERMQCVPASSGSDCICSRLLPRHISMSDITTPGSVACACGCGAAVCVAACAACGCSTWWGARGAIGLRVRAGNGQGQQSRGPQRAGGRRGRQQCTRPAAHSPPPGPAPLVHPPLHGWQWGAVGHRRGGARRTKGQKRGAGGAAWQEGRWCCTAARSGAHGEPASRGEVKKWCISAHSVFLNAAAALASARASSTGDTGVVAAMTTRLLQTAGPAGRVRACCSCCARAAACPGSRAAACCCLASACSACSGLHAHGTQLAICTPVQAAIPALPPPTALRGACCSGWRGARARTAHQLQVRCAHAHDSHPGRGACALAAGRLRHTACCMRPCAGCLHCHHPRERGRWMGRWAQRGGHGHGRAGAPRVGH